jgi:hypothetical protein
VNWVDLWGLITVDVRLSVGTINDKNEAKNENRTEWIDVRQKMADLATNNKDRTEWMTEGARNIPGAGDFLAGSYKCNQYVYEVAIEAGAKPGVLQNAGSWGNKDNDIPGWRVLDKNETPRPGDVVAITNPPGSLASGHMGIVVSEGQTSNTWDKGIIRTNNFGFRDEDKNAIFRRREGNE